MPIARANDIAANMQYPPDASQKLESLVIKMVQGLEKISQNPTGHIEAITL